MSLFDLFDTLSGRQSPQAQLYAALNQAPGQAGSPQPAPVDSAAPVSPPVAGASGAGAPPAVSSGPPGAPAAPAPPGGAPPPGGAVSPNAAAAAPPPPPPPATGPDGQVLASNRQSPSDLAQNNQQLTNPTGIMGLYLQAVQRQHAEEGLNRAMGGIAAAFAPPGQQAMWGRQFDVPQQDPAGIMGNIMALQQNQMAMQGRQQMLNNLPQIAKDMGITPAQAQAEYLADPQGFMSAVLTSQGLGAGANTAMGQMKAAQRAWQANHPNEPLPWDPGDPESYRAYAATNAMDKKNTQEQVNAGLEEAPDAIRSNQNMRDKLQWLNDHPAATQAALKNQLGLVSLQGWAGIGDQDKAQALNIINYLKSNLYAGEFKNTKNIRSQAEATNLGNSASMLGSGTLPPEQATGEISRLLTDANTNLANSKARGGQTLTPQEWAAANPLYKDKGKFAAGATVQNDLRNNPGGYADVPSGASYIAPDGTVRTKA